MEMPHEVFFKCRLCIEDLTSDCKDIRNCIDIQQKLKELYNLEVTPQDKCTTKICSTCNKKFFDHNTFKQQILTNQATLNQYMVWNEQTQQKIELVTIIDDDDEVDDKSSLTTTLASSLPPPNVQAPPAPSPLRLNQTTPPLTIAPVVAPPPVVRATRLASRSPCSKTASRPIGGDESDDDDVVFVSSANTQKTPTPPFVRIKEIVKRQCPNCSEEFEQFSEVAEHISRVHSVKNLKCKCCGEIVQDKHKHITECAAYIKRREKKTTGNSSSTSNLEPVVMDLEEDENLLVPMEKQAQPTTSERQSRTRKMSEHEVVVQNKPLSISKRRNTDYFTVPPWETDINQEVIQTTRRTARSKSVHQRDPEPEPEPVPEEMPKKKRGRPRSKSVYSVQVDNSSHNQKIPINFQSTTCIVNKSDQTEVEASENDPLNTLRSKISAKAPLHNVSNVRCSKQRELTKRLTAHFLNDTADNNKTPCTSIPKVVAEKHLTPHHTPTFNNNTLDRNATVGSSKKRKTPYHEPSYNYDPEPTRKPARKTPKYTTNYDNGPSNSQIEGSDKRTNSQPVYSFAATEPFESRKKANQEPTYILKPSSTDTFRVSVSNNIEPSSSKGPAIVMQIRKQIGGDHPNYVANIKIGANTPTTPPVDAAKTAHSTNKAPATAAPPKQPQSAAPAKISNNRRKSSISERRILPSNSDPNLMANIMQDMDRSTNTSTEVVSTVASATLKVLTPVQLNNGQMGQQQRQTQPHRVQQPLQQQQQQQPQRQQNQQQQFHNYQQQQQQQNHNQLNNNQQKQQHNHVQQQPQIRLHNSNQPSQQSQINHQQQHQIQQQNSHPLNWSQSWPVSQQQQQHCQRTSNGNMNQQQAIFGSIGQKNPHEGYQYGLDPKNSHSIMIPGILEDPPAPQSISQTNTSCDPPPNASPSSMSSLGSHHRHFFIKLCKVDAKKLGLKINSVHDNQEVQVAELSNVEKKLLRESIMEKTFYKEALKVFLKSDCTYVREQLNDIFMNKVPHELALTIGLVRPAGADEVPTGPNFYNERVDDDLEILT